MCDGRITVTNITPDNLIKFMVFTPILVGQKSWGWGPGICFLNNLSKEILVDGQV